MDREQRTLVLLAMQGDPEAFAALAAARRARLLLLLAATVGDWHEAEDALQDALWKAFTGLRQLRAPEAFDGWLRGIALHVARDRLRAAARRTRREGAPAGLPADLEALLSDVPGSGPPDTPDDGAACADILAAIAELPPLQRRAGHLTWVAGLPARQVAELLQLTPDGLHAALHRARRRLGAMFYAKGDWRKDVMRMQAAPPGTVLVGGPPLFPSVTAHLSRVRPDLRVAAVEGHDPAAHLKERIFWGEAPALEPTPPSPEDAVPLEGLADAAGFDLEPFGDRLARFTCGGRLHWLPYQQSAHVVLYNADLLQRAGLPLPAPDWTWDDFFGYCRRCAAAGLHPIDSYSPNVFDVAIVAEQLGATYEDLGPVKEAAAFVADWWRQGWAAPKPPDTWGLGPFLRGECVFFLLQYGHSPSFFRGFPRLRWGIAPTPRFRRSDPAVVYWFHHVLQVRGTAPDPVAAFAVARAFCAHGPVPELDNLPAYRTPETLRAWLAQPLPLGKECLLDLEAARGPLYGPLHLIALRGGGDALAQLLNGETEAGLRALRQAAKERLAGAPLVYR